MHALALVPLGPQWVEDASDHGRHLVAALCDLGDHDVRVIAVGGGDEGVRSLDPGGDERIGLEPGPDRELAAEVLPALLEADLEPGVGLGILVEAGNLVALPQHRPRDRRSDSAAADDQDEHGPDTSQQGGSGSGLSEAP